MTTYHHPDQVVSRRPVIDRHAEPRLKRLKQKFRKDQRRGYGAYHASTVSDSGCDDEDDDQKDHWGEAGEGRFADDWTQSSRCDCGAPRTDRGGLQAGRSPMIAGFERRLSRSAVSPAFFRNCGITLESISEAFASDH